MNIVTRLTLCAFVLLPAICGGCRNDPNVGPPGVRGDPLPEGAYPKNVAIEGLGEGIVAGRGIVQPGTADTPLRVTVPVRSISSKPLNVQYRFEFFDAQGRTLRSSPGWHFVHIDPRTEVQLDAAALETSAVDWRLTLRPAR